MNVIDQVKISRDDLKLLTNAKTTKADPVITIDEKGFVHWTSEDYITGNFEQIRNLAKANNLMIFENIAMYWLFPVSAFKGFEEVYVLTYMFKRQIQSCYYELFEVDYDYYSVANKDGHYKLVAYIPIHKEDKRHLRELIKIYYSAPTDRTNLNKVGEKNSAFSVTHLNNLVSNSKQQTLLRNNRFNFYHNKANVPSHEVMRTTYKYLERRLCPKI
ncbi:hypothetical protein [Halobacillus campisalis]|uniref:Uncharacterized protein n=1 Tax=Halobacillus campisalis TaxID=435909 RepID=A0ABW2K0A7_9BACI|nr:hypothetical protein [Halobacillus campisalis]